MAAHDPVDGLVWVAIGAVMLGFSSATQDIVIDAYRIEAADSDLQAMMSSAYIAGYRIGMLVAGAGVLALASWFAVEDAGTYDYQAWASAYRIMAACMLIGVLTTFLVPEPENTGCTDGANYHTSDYLRFLILFALSAAVFIFGFIGLAEPVSAFKGMLAEIGMSSHVAGFIAATTRLTFSIVGAGLMAAFLVKSHLVPRVMVQETYIAPFADFFSRYGKAAFYILLLVGTYRIADVVMGTVTNVFYSDMGYSKEQIAAISKNLWLVYDSGGWLSGRITVNSLWRYEDSLGRSHTGSGV